LLLGIIPLLTRGLRITRNFIVVSSQFEQMLNWHPASSAPNLSGVFPGGRRWCELYAPILENGNPKPIGHTVVGYSPELFRHFFLTALALTGFALRSRGGHTQHRVLELSLLKMPFKPRGFRRDCRRVQCRHTPDYSPLY
jgi:hypothetical protein